MIGLHPCVIITHRSIYYSFTISTRFINIVATTTLLFSHLPVHSYMSSLFTLHQVQACLPEETWKKTELWQAQQLFSHYLEVLILSANSLKLPDTQKSSDRLMRTMNRNVSVCLSVCRCVFPWEVMQCSAAMDILFLMDGSYSVGKGSFERSKHYAIKLCQALDIGPDKVCFFSIFDAYPELGRVHTERV